MKGHPYLVLWGVRKEELKNVDITDEEVAKRAAEYARNVMKGILEDDVTYFAASLALVRSLGLGSLEVWGRKLAYTVKDILLKDHRALAEICKMIGCKTQYPLHTFLRLKRPFPEMKIYHVPLSKGIVEVPAIRRPFLVASILFTRILELGEREVPPEWREAATKYYASIFGERKGRRSSFIERLLSLSGLEDFRKRIIFYWIAPYLVNVRKLENEEAVGIIMEWLSRQGGGSIPRSWILADVDNVRKKGILPWSVEKVRKIDPELVKELERRGIL